MKLNYKVIGDKGEPLIILHGLYGSSDNWMNIGQKLADKSTVYLVDQRNHGLSPHSKSHTYEDMSDDLIEFINDHNIKRANIIGHSMGGKTAIFCAVKNPEKISKLIVVDISPARYSPENSDHFHLEMHKNILNALKSLDLKNTKTIKEAESHLAQYIPYKNVRQFLLKNLKRDENKKFYWILNIDTLYNELEKTMDGIQIDESTKPIESIPALFIKGEYSEYIGDDDKIKIKKLFPKATITTIKNAGHWVHAEKQQEFLSVAKNFLAANH
ncbi:MAG: alpha/beta fold hydrolase [Bacteroidales bacterium]